ncbi:MAG: DUF1318 domain-containing protein [Acidobacteriota bacterium]
MHRTWILAGLAASALFAVACVTINVYFPEAEVQGLAEQIEAAVAREAAEHAASETMEAPAEEGSPEGPSASLFFSPQEPASPRASWLRESLDLAVGATLALLAPAPVYAQTDAVAAPEITNPAIRRIIQSRGARVAELNRHKASGALAESNRALVVVRQLDALPLQQRAAVQKLVKAENADRERMFKEIAAATGTDLSQLPKIRSTYAATLRQKARPGDWIQLPDGSYQQK